MIRGVGDRVPVLHELNLDSSDGPDQKFIVFKRDEFEKFFAEIEAGDDTTHDLRSLDDAVVIRTQDIFAGPGLSAYANAIQTGIDLNHFQDGPHRLVDVPHLENVRDYFFDRAREAFEHPNKKVPD